MKATALFALAVQEGYISCLLYLLMTGREVLHVWLWVLEDTVAQWPSFSQLY